MVHSLLGILHGNKGSTSKTGPANKPRRPEPTDPRGHATTHGTTNSADAKIEEAAELVGV
jgi:hypothetical protein